MEKLTFEKVKELFYERNQLKEKDNTVKDLQAVAVITEDSFNKPFGVEERSYKFSSNNFYFKPGKISNSLFADCLDNKDFGVRLDWYIHSAGDKWTIDYCYLVDDNTK